jgi:hypothetical protein
MPRRPLTLAALCAGTATALGAASVHAADGVPTAPRERPAEFLDSLADNAIAPDPNQIYRKDGKRREVDLSPGVIAWLDESMPSFLNSQRGTPATAGSPGRAIGIRGRLPSYGYDFAYERTVLGRRAGLGGDWTFSDAGDDPRALYALVRENRSDVADLPGTPPTTLRRRDAEVGLRLAGAGGPGLAPGSRWSTDWGWHRNQLTPEPASALAPSARGSQLVWRGALEPAGWPGLALNAAWAGEVGARERSSEAARGERIRLGASWTAREAWGPLPASTRLSWTESPRLGLLGDDEALTLPAAYRRSLGIDLPDGSTRGDGRSSGGRLYGQYRAQSLADPADRVGVLGWRRDWQPAPQWGLATQVEQAVPLGGSTPVRATQLGARLNTSRFPRLTFSTASELVNAASTDSAYQEFKLTQRLADDWLGALRVSATRSQPHGQPDAGNTDYKAAVALGWREPVGRNLHLLTRLTWAGLEADPAAAPGTAPDRRARIWLGHAGYALDAQQSVSLRLSRRAERDEGRLDPAGQPLPRRTDFWLTRWIWEQARDGDARWSLSLHAAGRHDTVDGRATGWGAELGYRLSSKAALTVGYNPRGFADNEITVEERPKQGVSLRLRFTIGNALARWLDSGRSDTPSTTGALGTLGRYQDAGPAGWAPALQTLEDRQSPSAF